MSDREMVELNRLFTNRLAETDSPAEGGAMSDTCVHPLDGIHWNEWNQVTQCLRCGHVMDWTPMPSGDAMRHTQGEGR